MSTTFFIGFTIIKLLTDTKKKLQIAVYSAYQNLIAYCAALRPHSTTNAGVWKFLTGVAFQAYCLRQNTAANLNVKEIHPVGLRKLTRITAEMRAILRA